MTHAQLADCEPVQTTLFGVPPDYRPAEPVVEETPKSLRTDQDELPLH